MKENELREIVRDNLILFEFENCIKHMILESQGISDAITEFIYKNKQKLFDLVTNGVGNGEVDSNGVEKSITSDRIPAFVKKYNDKNGEPQEIEHNILFTIISYNFKDRCQFAKFRDDYVTDYGTSNCDGRKIDWATIYTYTVNGKLNKPNYISTVSHEVSHIFKQDMAMNKIPKNDSRYLRALSDLNSGDKLISDIAKVIYYGEKLEQEGFANELYYKFRENEIQIPSWQVFGKSDEWKIYKDTYKIVQGLKNKKDAAQEVLNLRYNGMQVDSLIKFGEQSMMEFKKRLLRVLWKCHEDLLSEGVSFRGGDICSHLIIG